MVKKEIKQLILGSILLLSVSFLTGQFILEKKEKKSSRVSANVLREGCVKRMGNIVQTIPSIIHRIADIQSNLLAHICKFFDNEKCFLHSADKNQLSNLDQKLAMYDQQLKEMQKKLQEIFLYLQSNNSIEFSNNKAVKNNKAN